MHIPVFYAPPECRSHDIIDLPQEEGRHATQVLRLVTGSPVMIVDGLGLAVRAEICTSNRARTIQARVFNEIRNFGEPRVGLTLAAGLSTGYKFDTVIEKGTELGVKRFVPLLTQSSKMNLDDPKRIASRLRRWEKVALAAMKQSRRSYRPDISLPIGLRDFLNETDSEFVNLIFHPGNRSTPFDRLKQEDFSRRVTVLVGPESGFAQEEVGAASEAGYQVISLGGRILRTETAGPVVCALIMNLLGELS